MSTRAIGNETTLHRNVSVDLQGVRLRGRLYHPGADRPLPGLVVIHELPGLDDRMFAIAEQFAGAGYVTLAVDLYADRWAPICMVRYFIDQWYRPLANGRLSVLSTALTYLADQPEVDPQHLGAVGFCMGAGYALAWACGEKRLKAVAPFYGKNPPASALPRLCPVVGSYPVNDTYPTMHTHRDGAVLRQELERLQIPHDIEFYPNTNHAFWTKNRDETAVADSFRRVLDFFEEHL